MKIAFHGANAETFLPGFADLLDTPQDLILLSDTLAGPGEAEAFATADMVIGVKYAAGMPALSARLYQVPGAGYDGIDLAALPGATALCNVFGHEVAIAEYVMAALLSFHVPLAQADAQLRQGDWSLWAGKPTGLRTELSAQSVGIVGFGHIGKTLAARCAAFGMEVHVANRSPVSAQGVTMHPLTGLAAMAGQVDYLINTLPLTDSTRGLIGAEVLAALPAHGVVMNVGRGPVIAEQALYDALASGRIGGAVIDTWYVYPGPDAPNPHPGTLPFHELPNVTLTPHMSGWTHGTIDRRRAVMAENANRLARGDELLNRVR
ncbi:2-hydroxyacid dehydrogenase [Szabonella alba]|uniref:Phosphoglycerate dehydrogenase n=1 Tax=Szabonella alba TaxID=2804194 RepID=A0A8K0VC08_9RHOB|nr:2-hydroxyacid dehydrogenase [Szabonella alba]MBL4916979.1 phosphoglycerate dehydrogenase [Szabonella alba]